MVLSEFFFCFVVEEICSSFEYYNIRSIYNEIPVPIYFGKPRRFNKETKEFDIFLFNDSNEQRYIHESKIIENRVIHNYKKD